MQEDKDWGRERRKHGEQEVSVHRVSSCQKKKSAERHREQAEREGLHELFLQRDKNTVARKRNKNPGQERVVSQVCKRQEAAEFPKGDGEGCPGAEENKQIKQ